MSDLPLMKCGHTAQGRMRDGRPACIICAGIVEGWDQIADSPDLTGRKARCAYYDRDYNSWRCECDKCLKGSRNRDGVCHCEEPSSIDLAFFEYKPEKEYDEFYCGCHSWD